MSLIVKNESSKIIKLGKKNKVYIDSGKELDLSKFFLVEDIITSKKFLRYLNQGQLSIVKYSRVGTEDENYVSVLLTGSPPGDKMDASLVNFSFNRTGNNKNTYLLNRETDTDHALPIVTRGALRGIIIECNSYDAGAYIEIFKDSTLIYTYYLTNINEELFIDHYDYDFEIGEKIKVRIGSGNVNNISVRLDIGLDRG